MKFIEVEKLIKKLESYSEYTDNELIDEEKLTAILDKFGHDRFINRENNTWEK